MRYVIKNTNAYPLNGVRVGLYFDWDVPSASQYVQNAGGWNSADSVNWTAYRNSESGLISTYRGVKVLDGTLVSAYTADASAVSYYPDGFTEGEKFMSMASGITTGSTYADNSHDLAQVTAVGPIYLPSGAIDTVAFAVIIGQTLPEFSEAAAMAREAYDSKVADCCLNLRGNVDGDPADAANVSDLTFLVAVLFQGGDAPACTAEANIDGDSGDNVNVSDLTYLVAVLFQGADPVPCGEFAN